MYMIYDYQRKTIMEFIIYQYISVQNLMCKKLHVQYTSKTHRPI